MLVLYECQQNMMNNHIKIQLKVESCRCLKNQATTEHNLDTFPPYIPLQLQLWYHRHALQQRSLTSFIITKSHDWFFKQVMDMLKDSVNRAVQFFGQKNMNKIANFSFLITGHTSFFSLDSTYNYRKEPPEDCFQLVDAFGFEKWSAVFMILMIVKILV